MKNNATHATSANAAIDIAAEKKGVIRGVIREVTPRLFGSPHQGEGNHPISERSALSPHDVSRLATHGGARADAESLRSLQIRMTQERSLGRLQMHAIV